MDQTMPFLEIFLGFLGFGFSIIFCVTLCRACSRIREAQVEREARRYNQQEGGRSIYFIPFPQNGSQQDGEDLHRVASLPSGPPPRYSTTAYEAPPSYTELEFKPEDLPPSYTEYNIPVYPITPPPPADNSTTYINTTLSQDHHTGSV